MEIAMPETLEVLLWCTALATWLMFLFAYLSEGYKAVSKYMRRRVEIRLKAKK